MKISILVKSILFLTTIITLTVVVKSFFVNKDIEVVQNQSRNISSDQIPQLEVKSEAAQLPTEVISSAETNVAVEKKSQELIKKIEKFQDISNEQELKTNVSLQKSTESLKLSDTALLNQQDIQAPILQPKDHIGIAPKIENPKVNSDFKPTFSAWIGSGVNYLNFVQKSTVETESGQFSSIIAPTVAVGSNVSFTENSEVEFQFNDYLGEIKTKGETIIDKNSFHLKTLALEYRYLLIDSQSYKYHLLFGLQLHQMPFLSTDSNNNTVNVLDNEMLNGSIGFKVEKANSHKFKYELMLKYQPKISAKNLNGYDFKTQSEVNFDGVVGISRDYSNGLNVGLYWYGQYQNFNYSFIRSSESTTGSQTFFNSNFEIRFGWDFSK